MKKTITSAGILLVGAASLQAQTTPGSAELSRPLGWSASVSFRGFYDDNYATSPTDEQDSFGLEISPSFGLNWSEPGTSLSLNYKYSGKYYTDREDNDYDQSHELAGKLAHTYSENLKLDLQDSFIVTKEPTLGGDTPIRTESDRLENTVSIGVTVGVHPLVGVEVGYKNRIVDYKDDGFAALLNRVQHSVPINVRWQAMPKTYGILGYEFSRTEYDESDFKNSDSHKVYVGADQAVSDVLTASIRVGAEFVEYTDLPPAADDSASSPYLDASLSYRASPDTTLQLGLKHSRQATDVGTAIDQESTTVYGVANHRLAQKITGSLVVQYQHSSFDEPSDADDEDLFGIGANLGYEINTMWSAEAGYNFDRLSSSADREYTRNRIYIGAKAKF